MSSELTQLGTTMQAVRRKPEIVTVPLVFIAVLLAWHWWVRFFEVSPLMVPPPSAVFKALLDGISTGVFISHLWITFKEVIGGFALGSISGLALGALFAQSQLLERTIFVYVVAMQTVPKLAIAPLIIVWFGFGLESKIVISALICFFPMIANVIEGLRSSDRGQIDLLRVAGASQWQIFTMVKLPNALPFIFVGVKVGVVLAVLGAIVGEFVGAQGGIGFLILQYNYRLEIDRVFALIVLLSIMGIVLHSIVKMAHRKFIFWDK